MPATWPTNSITLSRQYSTDGVETVIISLYPLSMKMSVYMLYLHVLTLGIKMFMFMFQYTIENSQYILYR